MPLSQQNFTATLSQPDRFTAVLERGTPVPGPPGLPRVIHDEGVPLPVRTVIDMRGAGVTATDDPGGDRTVITIPGQTPWTQNIDAALKDLNSVGVVRFGPYTGEAGPDAGIGNEGGTLHILADNGGSVNIESFGSGRVMLSTDGTRRLVVHQNGKVGIGPSMNPAHTLDVQGDCNVSGVYRFPDGTTQATAAPVASVFGRIGAVIAAIGDYTVAQITGAVAATRRIIAGAGLLGGGDLSGDVTLSVDKAAVQSPWVADVDAAGKNLHNADTLTGKIFQLYRSDNPADQKRWVFQTNATDTLFGFTLDDAWSNQGIWLQVKRSGYMPTSVAFPSGNVGIGTADPQYKLDVAGDINVGSVSLGTDGGGVSIYLNGTSAIRNSGATYIDTGAGGSAPLVFRAGSGFTEVMRIGAAGSLTVTGTNSAGVNAFAGLVLDRPYGDVGDSMDIVWPSTARISANAVAGGEAGLIFYAQTASGNGETNEVFRIQGNGVVKLRIGGALKTLSVDGSGFVKAA